MKVVLIILGSVTVVGFGAYIFMKRPKATININDATGEGTATLGNQSGPFNNTIGVHLNTWNGYALDVNGTNGGYSFTRYGKSIESTDGGITPYTGGSSNVTINHIK